LALQRIHGREDADEADEAHEVNDFDVLSGISAVKDSTSQSALPHSVPGLSTELEAASLVRRTCSVGLLSTGWRTVRVKWAP
jgi:hypothetical protein